MNTKNYLFIETYGLGDRISTEALIFSALTQKGVGKVSLIANENSRGFAFPHHSRMSEILFARFPWGIRHGQRNPFHVLFSMLRFAWKFRGRFCDYIGVNPRGDFYQTMLLHLLRVKKIVSCDFTHTESTLQKFLGATNEHHAERRERLGLRLFGKDFRLFRKFLADGNISHENDVVLLAPETSVPDKEPSEDFIRDFISLIKNSRLRCRLVVAHERAVPQELYPQFDEIIKRPIADLPKLIREASVAVCSDSFIGHLCSACGVPVISLFGSTDPDVWRPSGECVVVRNKNGTKNLTAEEVFPFVKRFCASQPPPQ